MNDGSLEIRDVTVQFGGLTALDRVSLTARPRQVTGIIGPNGAGKTTLLNTACGFVKPQTGTVSFDGRELNGLGTHRLAALGIARTLQGVGLFPGLTVAENVMVGATPSARAGIWSALFGLPRSDRDERRLREQALTALERLGVADVADEMPDTLSYGLRKRVALARALAARPKLILLDEPASGLPENELPELGHLIADLTTEAGVVVIEHRMDLVMSVCDTIFVLDFGKLIAHGTPAEVQADPAVTAAYLGADGDKGPPAPSATLGSSAPSAPPSSPNSPAPPNSPNSQATSTSPNSQATSTSPPSPVPSDPSDPSDSEDAVGGGRD
jgi:branched-chain amino acid transport system ATP-binding protein